MNLKNSRRQLKSSLNGVISLKEYGSMIDKYKTELELSLLLQNIT